MGDDDSNCMGIKRPSLFITILDFIVFLVLIIGLLQIHYDASDDAESGDPENAQY